MYNSEPMYNSESMALRRCGLRLRTVIRILSSCCWKATPMFNAKEKINGVTALWAAAQNGQAEVVKILLEANADVSIQRITNGVTALWQAAQNGHIEVVRILLKGNADVRMQRKTDRSTALMAAAAGGHMEICRLLLDKGANVEARTADGETALMYASK